MPIISLSSGEDHELRWLLQKFLEKTGPVTLRTLAANPRAPLDNIKLENFYILRENAIKNIVVFGVSFENFDLLSKQIWKLVAGGVKDLIHFQDYTEFLNIVTRGSWEGGIWD